jgi:hypothetical protein
LSQVQFLNFLAVRGERFPCFALCQWLNRRCHVFAPCFRYDRTIAPWPILNSASEELVTKLLKALVLTAFCFLHFLKGLPFVSRTAVQTSHGRSFRFWRVVPLRICFPKLSGSAPPISVF